MRGPLGKILREGRKRDMSTSGKRACQAEGISRSKVLKWAHTRVFKEQEEERSLWSEQCREEQKRSERFGV